MFSYPTRRQMLAQAKKAELAYDKKGLKSSPTRAINKNIIDSAKNRNKRVKQQQLLENRYKSNINEINTAHRLALEKLKKDCDDAQKQIKDNAQQQLSSLKAINDKKISSSEAMHKAAVEKLNNEINTKKSKIDKLTKEVSEINQKIRKEESISRESESALKLKIGTSKKKIVSLEKDIEKLKVEKIGIIRMTDEIDKELKDSFNYLLKITEKEIVDKVKSIQDIKDKEAEDVKKILLANIKISTDIENKQDLKLNKLVDDVIKRVEEQKRLGNVQSVMIIDELSKSHSKLLSDLKKNNEEALRRLEDIIETKDNELKTGGELNKELSMLLKKSKEQNRTIRREWEEKLNLIKDSNKEEISKLKKLHLSELDSKQREIETVFEKTNGRIQNIVKQSETRISEKVKEIEKKQDEIQNLREKHNKEIENNNKANLATLQKLKDELADKNTKHSSEIKQRDVLIASLKQDNQKIEVISSALKKELDKEKMETSKLEKELHRINVAHSKKLQEIKSGEKAVSAELIKIEQKKKEYVATLQKECESTATKLTATLSEKSKLEKSIKDFEVKNNKLQQELREVKANKESMDRKLNLSNTTRAQKSKQIKDLVAKSLVKDENINKLNTEITELRSKVRKIQTEHSAEKANIEQKLNNELAKTMKEKNKLDKEQNELKRKIHCLTCYINQSKIEAGLDAENNPNCKLINNDLVKKIDANKQNNIKDKTLIKQLNDKHRELEIQNRELQKLTPKINDLERQLKEMRSKTEMEAVAKGVANRAEKQLLSSRDTLESYKEQIEILEKAVFLPWTISNCYGKQTKEERELCRKYESFGNSFPMHEAQRAKIRQQNLVRYKNSGALLSSKIRDPALKRKLMIIENTGFVTRQFKDDCILPNGEIKTSKKCKLARRNYTSRVNKRALANSLDTLNIRPGFIN